MRNYRFGSLNSITFVVVWSIVETLYLLFKIVTQFRFVLFECLPCFPSQLYPTVFSYQRFPGNRVWLAAEIGWATTVELFPTVT